MNQPLVIALPKGSLYDEAAERLREAGIAVPTRVGRRLTVLTDDGKELLANFLAP